MRRSFKAIANFMDPLTPPKSLRQLASLHRAVDSHETLAQGTVSFQQIVKRHKDPTKIRLLWYNTFLLHGVDVSLACRGPGGNRVSPHFWEDTFGAKPAFAERARELGRQLANVGYDVMALGEVFSDSIRDDILVGWHTEPPYVQGPPSQGRIDLPADPFVKALRLIPGIPHLPVKMACPLPATKLTFSAKQGNSGLLTIAANQKLGDVQTRDYDASGDPLQDIDYYSAKGVLKTPINLGFGSVNLYSTHLNAGGNFLLSKDPKSNSEERDRRLAIKEAQIGELVSFVKEEQRKNEGTVAIVVGDLNIDGTPVNNSDYTERLKKQMDNIDMKDLWVLRSKDGDGTVTAGSTSIKWKKERDGEKICDLKGAEFLCNDLTPPMIDRSRLDYIFLQDQKPQHNIVVDVTRPRRVLFRRPIATEDMAYLSDHLGLEITLIINQR